MKRLRTSVYTCMINIRRGLCGYKHVLWDDEKAEDFCLYMQHNNIDVDSLTDIRKTGNEC